MACGSLELVPQEGGVPPTIDGFLPLPGFPVTRLTPVEFDVADDSGALALMFVIASFPTGDVEAVWSGDGGFSPRYAASSSAVTTPCGFHFSVRRTGGWLGNAFRVAVWAVDADGNVTTTEAGFGP
ncbi:MAG: hypothetical protein L3K06_05665 [Thermoplasmata archaeon]|nr:hypothetical protein [Thermoplasmata archaeon]